MRILCVYQHYANFDCANSGRLYTFLQHLGKNHQVTLISSDHWQDQRITDLYPWVPENVDWVPVSIPYSNSMTSLQRLRSYLQFPATAFRKGRKIKTDLVYGISTPLTTGWAAKKLAEHHDVPFVFEIRDLWPDFPIQMGAVSNQFIQKKLYNLEKSLYQNSDHVVTVSSDMTDHVLSKGVDRTNVTTLLQGTNIGMADEACQESTPLEFDFGSRKAVLYAGTFGRANAIPTVLEVAQSLEDQKDIVFVFTGEGYHGRDIRMATEKSSNVVLLPPVPRHKILQLFRAATCAIVPFSDLPVLKTNSPAKFFDSLAVGTPVVVTNDGWSKKFVEDHACGLFAPIASPELISKNILTIVNSSDKNSTMGENGMSVARQLFDRDAMAEQLENIFNDAVRSRDHSLMEQTT